jgi:hypothetical protein
VPTSALDQIREVMLIWTAATKPATADMTRDAGQ